MLHFNLKKINWKTVPTGRRRPENLHSFFNIPHLVFYFLFGRRDGSQLIHHQLNSFLCNLSPLLPLTRPHPTPPNIPGVVCAARQGAQGAFLPDLALV